MNRPEYSLSLDSVICRRCNTISRAEDDTCPKCGADRQGAIFTSHADTAPPFQASAAAAAAPMPEEPLDFVDLRDTGWLTRMARRKMVTSYPSVAEPGDEPPDAVRKPARKGLAVLIGGVVAGLAAGGYLYTQSGPGNGAMSPTGHPAISVAGAIRDKSSTANDADGARHDALTRDRAEEPKVTAKDARAGGSEAVAKNAAASSARMTAHDDGMGTIAQAPAKANGAAKAPALSVARDSTLSAPVANSASQQANIAARTPEQAQVAAKNAESARAQGASRQANIAARAPEQTQVTAKNADSERAQIASQQANIAARGLEQAQVAAKNAESARAQIASQEAKIAARASEQAPVAPKNAELARAQGASQQANIAARTPGQAQVTAKNAEPTRAQIASQQTTIAARTPEQAKAASTNAEPTRAQAASRQAQAESKSSPTAKAPTYAQTTPQAPRAAAKDDRRARTTLASADKPTPATPEPTIARSIAAVEQSLASRDLSAARRNMRPLRGSESRSPEIQQLAADLSRQERARDAALASARVCAMNKDPACAVRNARRAVALDSRNPQTHAVLRQAMAVQTDVNTAYFRQASAIPAPIAPAMTFDGRWSATHPRTIASDDDRSNYSVFGWGAPAVSRGRGDAH